VTTHLFNSEGDCINHCSHILFPSGFQTIEDPATVILRACEPDVSSLIVRNILWSLIDKSTALEKHDVAQ